MKHPLRKHPGLLVPRALLLLSAPLAAADLTMGPAPGQQSAPAQQPTPAPVEAPWQTGGWEYSAYGGVATTTDRDVHYSEPGSTIAHAKDGHPSPSS